MHWDLQIQNEDNILKPTTLDPVYNDHGYSDSTDIVIVLVLLSDTLLKSMLRMPLKAVLQEALYSFTMITASRTLKLATKL